MDKTHDIMLECSMLNNVNDFHRMFDIDICARNELHGIAIFFLVGPLCDLMTFRGPRMNRPFTLNLLTLFVHLNMEIQCSLFSVICGCHPM